MKKVRQEAILEKINGSEVLEKLEKIGRVCYRSEDKIKEGSAEKFVRNLIRRGHESVLEHVNVTAYLTVDRAIAQEITRHRIGSFTHESTRYVRYKELEVIVPMDMKLDPAGQMILESALLTCEATYRYLVKDQKIRPEMARDVLPLATASRLVVTFNLRQWRHFFRLRLLGETGSPHPKIQMVAMDLMDQFLKTIPVIFEDLMENEQSGEIPWAGEEKKEDQIRRPWAGGGIN
jgi:thymidylate synthase (FAD)